MKNPLPKTESRSHDVVIINQPEEVTYWTRVFLCSEALLRKAVASVGPKTGDVRSWIKKQKAKTNDGSHLPG